MKKVFAIVLLLVLLINTMGYQFIFSLLQQKAYNDMVVRLDNREYRDDELLELSTPLNLPYFTNWQHFERCDGRITIDGFEYNYVARRYVNNVMIYKCIPNGRQQNLKLSSCQANKAVFETAVPGADKKQGTCATAAPSLPEYLYCTLSTIPCTLMNEIMPKRYAALSCALCDAGQTVPTPPPDLT